MVITGLPCRVTVTASKSWSNCSGKRVITSRISEIEYVLSDMIGASLYNILYKEAPIMSIGPDCTSRTCEFSKKTVDAHFAGYPQSDAQDNFFITFVLF